MKISGMRVLLAEEKIEVPGKYFVIFEAQQRKESGEEMRCELKWDSTLWSLVPQNGSFGFYCQCSRKPTEVP